MRNHAWLFSAWHRILLGGMLFVAAVFGTPLQAQAIGASELISLTNIERSKNGLPSLVYNGRLASSAYAKAQDMLAKGYWAHTSPDGLSPWTFVSAAGYAYVTVGENLARDFSTDGGIMAGWMGSAGHRANILNPGYRDIGIAVVSGSLNGTQTTLVVAHYGATAAPAPRPAPAPAPVPDQPARPRPQPKPAVVARSVEPQPVVQATTQAQTPAQTMRQPVPKQQHPKDVLIDRLVKLLEPQESDLI